MVLKGGMVKNIKNTHSSQITAEQCPGSMCIRPTRGVQIKSHTLYPVFFQLKHTIFNLLLEKVRFLGEARWNLVSLFAVMFEILRPVNREDGQAEPFHTKISSHMISAISNYERFNYSLTEASER